MSQVISPSSEDPSEDPRLHTLRIIYQALQGLFFLVLVIGIILGWHWLKDPEKFPVRVVKVQATYEHVSRQTLEQEIMPYADLGFFGLNSSGLTKQLMRAAWIEGVKVQRIWPDTIVVQVTEHTPVARWGKNALLNSNGKIFNPPVETFPPNLPLFNASDHQATRLLEYYKKMVALLNPLHLSIQEMSADNRQAIILILTNGTQLSLGQTDILIRLQRFVKAYAKISTTPEQEAESIDLRYENGFSIKWRQSGTKQPPTLE